MNPQQSSIDLYLQALSQLKKTEICELAAQQNLDLSGKKSEVISRLCDKFRSSQKPEVVKGQEDDDSDEEDAFLDASDIVENELEEIKTEKNSPCEITVKKESTGAKRENFKNALEFVPEFDPDLMEFEFWKNSIKAATDCYQIVESDRKLIVHRKIMGRAKTWLQSDHANLFLSSDALLDKMAALFSLAVRKSDSRRRLQERKWSSIEPFTKYCQEKIILANKLKLENEELVDEIIAGVGDVQLEDHLRMMNFADPMAMMAACKDVKKRKISAPFRNNGPRLCFQCNSPNHVFSACPEKPKPKMGVGRSPAGAEYVKREKSSQLHHHQGASDRHQNIHCLSFGENVSISIIGDKYLINNVRGLCDSGSPVSLVSRKLVNINNILPNDKILSGIGGNGFCTLGRVKLTVKAFGQKSEILFYIVHENLIAFDVLLGRDFMKINNIKLTKIDNCPKLNY